jgi:putative nucleotidyltransferase with HDIG domain
MILAALTLFSFMFTIKVPGVPASISVSETFVFASVLLFGTAAATVTVALNALIMSSWRHRREPLKVLFNAAEPTLSIWVASQLFFAMLSGDLRPSSRPTTDLLLPVLALSVAYFLLNSSLTAIAIGLQTGSRILSVWREHFLWLALNYLGGASVAVLIVRNSSNVNITTLSIILPLLVMSYLTFKSSMGRAEDANKHLLELNRMYMSTIETLAMAVDAKDQITHGHIRRVQSYATQLAVALGMDEPALFRAIEASALLHDIGKLGIPEYILNKPGKLIRSEFEQMKTHAALGADMLSAIEFPFPVVPIVRHHHENWDGSGYPDGLLGVDIPIGARILAVVDCFDALTSDRPYRKQLSFDAALRVLQEQRGSMYDPLVVDTFVRLHSELTAGALRSAESPIDWSETARAALRLDRSPSMFSPEQLGLSTARETVFYPVIESAATSLNTIRPECLCVVYRVDENTNELVAAFVSHPTNPSLIGLRIPLARQLSGWVGANRTMVSDSDAALDLGSWAAALSLKTALSAPIVSGTTLAGVLALYRSAAEPFSAAERDQVESTCRIAGLELSIKSSQTLAIHGVNGE